MRLSGWLAIWRPIGISKQAPKLYLCRASQDKEKYTYNPTSKRSRECQRKEMAFKMLFKDVH